MEGKKKIKEESEQETIEQPNEHKRTLTAEGWKRRMATLKKEKTKPET